MARRKTDAHVQWTADGVCRYFRISWSKKFGDTFALILVPSYLVALICSSYRRLSKHTGSEPPFLHTLYSMALHAYHVPLAVLVGLLASRSTSLTTVDESSSWFGLEMDPFIRPLFSTIFLVGLMLGSILSIGLLVNLSAHDELHATSQGDQDLREYLSNYPPSGYVYSENVHWGHSYGFDPSIKTTSVPSLGLLTLDETVHQKATAAIRSNDIPTLRSLNIGHAVSSPIGTLALTLGPSPYWSVEQSFDGARYWKLWDEPSPSRVTNSGSQYNSL